MWMYFIMVIWIYPRRNLTNWYQNWWFSKCISFQIWIFWVSMLVFQGVEKIGPVTYSNIIFCLFHLLLPSISSKRPPLNAHKIEAQKSSRHLLVSLRICEALSPWLWSSFRLLVHPENQQLPPWKGTILSKRKQSSSKPSFSSWWFQPVWKICSSNWKSSPSLGGENKKMFETTT